MKIFRSLIVLLVLPFICISCNEDTILVADIEDLSSNKLTGSRWVMLPENISIDSGSIYSAVASIEFFGSKKCLFNYSLADYANQPIIYFYDQKYSEETNKGRLLNYNVDFIVVDNELFLTEVDYNGVAHTFTFTKDINYVAPSKDCPLIGFWQGKSNHDVITDWNGTYYLNIINNQRLIFYNNFTDDSYSVVLEYQFDGKILSFKQKDQIITFQLKENKLVNDYATLTKGQHQ